MNDVCSVRPVWLELDLDALASNLHDIRSLAGHDKKVIASIKANGYGHGAVEVARALADLGVDMLATGSFDEAVAVREAGVEVPILMFGGCEPRGIATLLTHGLIPTVYDHALARAASEAGIPSAPVFIKVDCGFGRLGVPLTDAKGFVKDVLELPNLVLGGIYTHLPFADEPGREWAADRIRAFAGLLDELAAKGIDIPITQALASASIITGIPDPCTAICPGYALYGLSPVDPSMGTRAPSRPVLRALRTRLVHVYSTAEDRRFGTGGSRRARAGTVIGVVPIGLTDGYRTPPGENQAWMLCKGKRVPVLGVSLEHTSLDLSSVSDVQAGQEVTVLGDDGGHRIGIDDLGRCWNTSPLGVLMSFSGRATISW
jgi:alanine racemase